MPDINAASQNLRCMNRESEILISPYQSAVISNCFHHLSRIRCNQDENEFTLALACVISQNVRFREGFLAECGFGFDDEKQKVVPQYQWTSAYGRPDLVLEVRADDDVVATIHIETKVASKPRKGQIDRHLKGLENKALLLKSKGFKNVYSRLVVVSEYDAPLFPEFGDVAWVSWDTVHEVLKKSRTDKPVEDYLVKSLAKSLEERGMAEFEGFDVDRWSRYLEIYEKNHELIEDVQRQIARFVKEVKSIVAQRVKSQTEPFDAFRDSIHGRGYQSKFWIRGKRGTPQSEYFLQMKVEPDEGWIETSIWTTRSADSVRLLENLKDSRLRRRLKDWLIWYVKGEEDDTVDIEGFEEVMKLRPPEASIYHPRYVTDNMNTFGSKEVLQSTLSEMQKACRLFKRLS